VRVRIGHRQQLIAIGRARSCAPASSQDHECYSLRHGRGRFYTRTDRHRVDHWQ
jgi:hypothetical protein